MHTHTAVFLVNAVGTGAISDYSMVTGEMICATIDCIPPDIAHVYMVHLYLHFKNYILNMQTSPIIKTLAIMY